VFYTIRNARRLDNYRRMIVALPQEIQDLIMGPLLGKASVHANTAGVFKGFYKNKTTGVGQFGGTGLDALSRITGTIELEVPILSRYECDVHVLQGDTNALASVVRDLDVAYIDPPYNQHPYGSNYFMLNLLVNYQRPTKISKNSGIPTDWRRSGYNVRAQSLPLFVRLLDSLDAKYFLISFNNEGFITPDKMRATLNRFGKVEVMETRYNAFRGSRNFLSRPVHVTEQLFLVERS
jgi:adenine-specific DNA-methyltransferase